MICFTDGASLTYAHNVLLLGSLFDRTHTTFLIAHTLPLVSLRRRVYYFTDLPVPRALVRAAHSVT